jgi:hypothetical protein
MTMGKGSRQPMPAVRKPQAKVLATWFATILARRGRGNCRPRSRSGDAGARTMARQVRRGFAWPDCQQRVITVARVPCAAVLSAQEASCIPQSGQQTCGLGPCCTGLSLPGRTRPASLHAGRRGWDTPRRLHTRGGPDTPRR